MVKQRTEEDVTRAWVANDVLLREQIHPLVIEPLSKPPGLSTEDEWDYILATSLARCFDTFRAVQILCDPNRPGKLWVDAYILSRSIFEASITLRWCDKSPQNLERFLDDYHVRVARVFDSFPSSKQSEVTPERRTQILEREQKVLQKHKRGSGTLSVMVGIEEMCRELSKNEGEPNSQWQYDNYYRDVSSFAHLTTWHLFSYRAKLTPITEIVPSADIGFRALLVSGGCFLQILERWNRLFKRLPNPQPYEWLREWEASVRANETSRVEK